MTYYSSIVYTFLFLLLFCCKSSIEKTSSSSHTLEERPAYTLVLHGGAGTILRKHMSPGKERAYRTALSHALKTGQKILAEGGTALDAVSATIMTMENDSLFNSAKGAVFTHDGHNELDASIMDGSTLDAGAVAGVTQVKNPILAARAVMEKSPHVLLSGQGADAFSRSVGLELVKPSYFRTEKAWNTLQNVLRREQNKDQAKSKEKHGTVGAIALDQFGNLAAGTSTGGMTNKRWNRIGDSPIIGAGTYADNASCAVSATGHGEYFIRYAVAHDISALIQYKGLTVQEAGDLVIQKKLKQAGGAGGVIILDRNGNISMPFNTEGMYRGFVTPDSLAVYIYKDE